MKPKASTPSLTAIAVLTPLGPSGPFARSAVSMESSDAPLQRTSRHGTLDPRASSLPTSSCPVKQPLVKLTIESTKFLPKLCGVSSAANSLGPGRDIATCSPIVLNEPDGHDKSSSVQSTRRWNRRRRESAASPSGSGTTTSKRPCLERTRHDVITMLEGVKRADQTSSPSPSAMSWLN